MIPNPEEPGWTAKSIEKKVSNKELNYFQNKWQKLEDETQKYKKIKPFFFKNICSMIIYAEWLRSMVKINDRISNKLYDWFLKQTIVFKDKKFDKLKDFYLAQKLPEEIISSIK